jgi:hypothetical protein
VEEHAASIFRAVEQAKHGQTDYDSEEGPRTQAADRLREDGSTNK